MHGNSSGTRSFGTTHAEAGSYLLWLWGLPDTVVEAVAFHHSPAKCPDHSFGPLTAVHVADALEHEITGATPVAQAALDMDYLSRIEVVNELPDWSSLAREQLSMESA